MDKRSFELYGVKYSNGLSLGEYHKSLLSAKRSASKKLVYPNSVELYCPDGSVWYKSFWGLSHGFGWYDWEK